MKIWMKGWQIPHFLQSWKQLAYDPEVLVEQVSREEPKLTDDKKTALNQIKTKVEEGGGFLFLDAPGGTFVTNAILH